MTMDVERMTLGGFDYKWMGAGRLAYLIATTLERAGADALAQISAISGDVRIHRARLENGQIVPGVMVASINLANEAIEWYVRSGDASASE